MKRIQYYYTSLSKQGFILALAVFFAVRMGVFFISGMYRDSYLLLSVLMYAAIFAACAFCFVAYRFFYTEFDREKAIYVNRLLRRTREVELGAVRKARFTRRGIFLYDQMDSDAAIFHIPFYRFGNISPVGVEHFQDLLRKLGVKVSKEYEVMPGYTRWAQILGGGYVVLTILLLGSAIPHILLLFLILFSGK